MQNYVFVLDTNRVPQEPVHPAAARRLLKDGKAAVLKRFPFTIILKEAKQSQPEPVQIKFDPGSKTTGIALVQSGKVIFAAELTHRGQQIKDALESRRAVRRNRRNRKTRYRAARFDNRTRQDGWLPPSLESRVNNLRTWLYRFTNLCNVRSISMELVKFDTQLMQNAEVSGVEYQQGELQGYEVREYLLEKFSRKCSYCGKTDLALEIEHIIPKCRGGSNRVSNLCLACRPCNVKKGSKTAEEFGHSNIQKLAKQPLKDATAVNAVRWAVWRMFDHTGLRVEVGTGGRTKFNRTSQDYPKAHWIDAACVGESGEKVKICPDLKPLAIKAVGRQSRQMCRPDKFGFPRTGAKENRVVKGFQTGDIVKAVVTSGKKVGCYVGKVAVRSTGSFNVTTKDGTVQGLSCRFFSLLHGSDGYSFS